MKNNNKKPYFSTVTSVKYSHCQILTASLPMLMVIFILNQINVVITSSSNKCCSVGTFGSLFFITFECVHRNSALEEPLAHS